MLLMLFYAKKLSSVQAMTIIKTVKFGCLITHMFGKSWKDSIHSIVNFFRNLKKSHFIAEDYTNSNWTEPYTLSVIWMMWFIGRVICRSIKFAISVVSWYLTNSADLTKPLFEFFFIRRLLSILLGIKKIAESKFAHVQFISLCFS